MKIKHFEISRLDNNNIIIRNLSKTTRPIVGYYSNIEGALHKMLLLMIEIKADLEKAKVDELLLAFREAKLEIINALNENRIAIANLNAKGEK